MIKDIFRNLNNTENELGYAFPDLIYNHNVRDLNINCMNKIKKRRRNTSLI